MVLGIDSPFREGCCQSNYEKNMMMPLTQVTNGEVLSVKFKVYAITYPMMHA